MKLKKEISRYSIIKINLIIFLLSFIILYYFEINYNIKTINIDKIDSSFIQKTIKIEGEIIKIKRIKNKTLIFNIRETKTNKTIIGIIFYNKNNQIISLKNLKSNKYFNFIGKIQIYNNEKEILIDKISENKK